MAGRSGKHSRNLIDYAQLNRFSSADIEYRHFFCCHVKNEMSLQIRFYFPSKSFNYFTTSSLTLLGLFLHRLQTWLLFPKWLTDFLLSGILLLGFARDFRSLARLKEEKYAVLGENFSAPKYVKLIQKQAITRGQPSKENAKITFWTRLLLKQRSKDF